MCAKITKASPLAPANGFPDLPVIAGVAFASGAAGVKYMGRDDVMLAVLEPGAAVAGVFTRSATRSAPVLDCQKKLAAGFGESATGAAILVNSGNSNAFTGRAGLVSVDAITRAVSDACDVPQDRVFTASTGVIGEPLPHDRIISVLTDLNGRLSYAGASGAARAIMTTDTFAKGSFRIVETTEGPISISGFAKGSGMIAPDMATMLVYIFTDARIEQADLQDMVSRFTDATFNAITVDSDTSTSDSLVVAATKKSGPDLSSSPTDRDAFATALKDVMLELAHLVVRDGEGATKFVEVRVTGATTDDDARKVAMSIANSPLVKTAIAGEDPNWGRVVMAVGKSGATADRDRLKICFGDIVVAENGWVSPDYKEADGAAYMARQDLVIATDLGVGTGSYTAWTCDLTHDYISINADYRS